MYGNEFIQRKIGEFIMKKNYLIRSRAVGMAIVLAFTTVTTACGASADKSADASTEDTSVETDADNSDSDALQSQIEGSNFGGDSSATGKEETVYVISDANGENGNVIVSDWLKNPGSDSTLSDKSDLTDIKSVKGNATFTQNSDGTITWDNTDGTDVYYQGSSSEELPVDVKITYYLDGKEISADDLAGKSGKVKIRFDYTNNSVTKKMIGGKETDIYTPFAVVSGVMLPSDKFSNVEVTSGKVISDANNYVVMGVALPGLADSLNVDEEKLQELSLKEDGTDAEIPNYVEVTADVTDFELSMTLTMASDDALSQLGLSNIGDNDKISGLSDDMDKLSDGMSDLEDGGSKLKDGAKDLKDGTKNLKSGASDLNDGVSTLKDGTTTLKSGTSDLATGSDTLKDGISTYTNGVATADSGAQQLDDGVSTLQSGVNDLSSGASKLNDGISTAKAGAAKLKTGTGAAATGSGSLATGAAELSAGTTKLLSAIEENQKLTQSTYYAADLTEQVLNNIVKSKSLSLYASRFMVRSAAIQQTASCTFDGNGGSSIGAVITTTVDEEEGTTTYTVEEPTEEPTRKGYTFTGWYLNEDATGDEVEFPYTLTGSVTFYAGWSKDSDESDDASSVASSAATDESSKESSKDSSEDEDENSDDSSDENSSSESGSGSGSSSKDDADVDDSDVSEQSLSSDDSGSSSQSVGSVSSEIILYADGDGTISQSDYEGLSQVISYYGKNVSALESDATYGTKINYILSSFLGSGNTITSLSSASSDTLEADIKLCETAKTFYASSESIKAGAQELATQSNNLYKGILELDAGANDLYNGLDTISAGSVTLMSGVNTLSGGVSTLKNGSSSLRSGMDTLNSNSPTLVSGAADLSDGAWKLDDGAKDLDDGVTDLYSGSTTLYNGTVTLDDGAKTLLEGATDLSDGLVKFDEEGISKLTEAFEGGDLTEFTDRLDALNEASKSYTTYGGASDDMDSSVKFIYKTEGIKTGSSDSSKNA